MSIEEEGGGLNFFTMSTHKCKSNRNHLLQIIKNWSSIWIETLFSCILFLTLTLRDKLFQLSVSKQRHSSLNYLSHSSRFKISKYKTWGKVLSILILSTHFPSFQYIIHMQINCIYKISILFYINSINTIHTLVHSVLFNFLFSLFLCFP